MSDTPMTEPPSERLSISERAAKRDRMAQFRVATGTAACCARCRPAESCPSAAKRRTRIRVEPHLRQAHRRRRRRRRGLVRLACRRDHLARQHDRHLGRARRERRSPASGSRTVQPVNILHDDAFPTWIRYQGTIFAQGQRATTRRCGHRRERLSRRPATRTTRVSCSGCSILRRVPASVDQLLDLRSASQRRRALPAACRTAPDGPRAAHVHAARCRCMHTARGAADHRHGRRLVSAPADDGSQPLRRHPEWIRARLPSGANYHELKGVLRGLTLNTVCEEARCPNIGECWEQRTATIMILGDTCTRACGFCAVKTGRPTWNDEDEPRRVAEAIRQMGLEHVVVTSVARDDLPDGGAHIFAETIRALRRECPGMGVEVLIPDFNGDGRAAADGHGGRAGHPQPQRRDRRAAPEAGPQACPLPPLAGRAGPGQGVGAARSPAVPTRSTPSRA